MQASGALSSRQRWTFDPWRMRPSETWSKVISTTSSGRRATHSSSRPCGPAAGLAAAALAGLVRRQEVDELALLLGREAAGVPDLAQAAAVVEAEDERADGALGLARAPAHDDGVDGAHALDLDHARALAGQVGRRGLLGDDALGLVQPVLGIGRGAHDVGQRDRRLDVRLERGAALVVGALEQDLVVERQDVEGVVGRRRLLGQARDARRGRVDALAERVEGGGDDLAVEHVAPGREDQLGEVAAQRLAVARLQVGLVAVDEGDCAKAVVLGLVGPAVAFGQGGSRARELGCERRVQRKRHRAAP